MIESGERSYQVILLMYLFISENFKTISTKCFIKILIFFFRMFESGEPRQRYVATCRHILGTQNNFSKIRKWKNDFLKKTRKVYKSFFQMLVRLYFLCILYYKRAENTLIFFKLGYSRFFDESFDECQEWWTSNNLWIS